MALKSLPASFILVLLLLLPLSEAAASPDTPLSEVVLCVYPISGTYGTLPRFVFYLSVFSTIILRHREWLVAGILATVMLYTSAAALHAWIILCNSGVDPEVFDLDIIPISTILLSTTGNPVWLLVSPSIPANKARPLIILWMGGVVLGSIACSAAMSRAFLNVESTAFVGGICLDNDGTTQNFSRSATRLSSSENNLNCTYKCPSSSVSVIRGTEEIAAITSHGGQFLMVFLCFTVLLLGTGVSAGFIFFISHTSSLQDERGYNFWDSRLGRLLMLIWSCLPPIMAFPLGEALMLGGPRLPVAEREWAVGQWTPPVCAGFILLAALLDRYIFEPRRLTGKTSLDPFIDKLKNFFRWGPKDHEVSTDLELGALAGSDDAGTVRVDGEAAEGPTEEGRAEDVNDGSPGRVSILATVNRRGSW